VAKKKRSSKKKTASKKTTRRRTASKKTTRKKTTRKKGTRKKTTGKKTARKKIGRRGKRKTMRKKAPSNGRRKKTVTSRGRRPRLASMPLSDLVAEVERRREQLVGLRHELEAELDAVDQELAALGATQRPSRRAAASPRGGRRRSGRGGSLVDTLEHLLAGTTMTIQEAVDAVQRAGYRSKSPNFRNIVNQALLANKDRFRKVARGQYTAR
jgi:hypothetical protein